MSWSRNCTTLSRFSKHHLKSLRNLSRNLYSTRKGLMEGKSRQRLTLNRVPIVLSGRRMALGESVTVQQQQKGC